MAGAGGAAARAGRRLRSRHSWRRARCAFPATADAIECLGLDLTVIRTDSASWLCIVPELTILRRQAPVALSACRTGGESVCARRGGTVVLTWLRVRPAPAVSDGAARALPARGAWLVVVRSSRKWSRCGFGRWFVYGLFIAPPGGGFWVKRYFAWIELLLPPDGGIRLSLSAHRVRIGVDKSHVMKGFVDGIGVPPVSADGPSDAAGCPLISCKAIHYPGSRVRIAPVVAYQCWREGCLGPCGLIVRGSGGGNTGSGCTRPDGLVPAVRFILGEAGKRTCGVGGGEF